MSRVKLAIIAAALAASTTSFATAEPVTPRTEDVSLSGLDLSSQQGLTIAERRIRHAAEDVCGKPAPRASLVERNDYRSCYNAAYGEALNGLAGPSGETFASREKSQG